MDHRARTTHRGSHSIRVANISDSHLQLEMTQSVGGSGGVPDQRSDLPSVLDKARAQACSHESGRTCYDNRLFPELGDWLRLLGDRNRCRSR
jgi:hypothetical protein